MGNGVTFAEAVRIMGGPPQPEDPNLIKQAINYHQQAKELCLDPAARLDVLSRHERNRQLEALHALLNVAAFAETLIDTAGMRLEAAKVVLPATKAVVGAALAELPADALTAVISGARIALPASGIGRGPDPEAVAWYRTAVADLATAMSDGRTEESRAWRRRGQITSIVRIAEERYLGAWQRLAQSVPDFAVWFGPSEGRVGKPVDRLQGFLTGPSGRPGDLRAAVTVANRSTLERPIWPGDVDAPTLMDGFVPPPFRELGKPARDDVLTFLMPYLLTPAATTAPLLVMGPGGAGKTTLARALVGGLPSSDFFAIQVPLLDTTADAIPEQIEESLRRSLGRAVDWTIVARSAGRALPVVVLDGIDELPGVPGPERCSAYLHQIHLFQQQQAEAGVPVAVVATCSDSSAQGALRPVGTTVITLDPFGPDQVRAWVSAWRPDEPYWRSLPEKTPAASPLTLVLLILSRDVGADQLDRTIGNILARLLAPFELDWLVTAAFSMLNRGRRRIGAEELIADFAALHPAEGSPTQVSRGRWLSHFLPPVDPARSTFALVHPALADHVVAWQIHQLLTAGDQDSEAKRRLVPLLSFALLKTHPSTLFALADIARSGGAARMWSPTTTLAGPLVAADSDRPDGPYPDYLPRSLAVPLRRGRLAANLLQIGEVYGGAEVAEAVRARWATRFPGLDLALDAVDAQKPAGSGLVITFQAPDRKWAAWIATQLEEAGLPATLDEWTVRPEDNFPSRVREAGRTLLIGSADLYRAAAAAAEWTSSAVATLPVTLLRVTDVRVPDHLGELPRVDLVGLDAESARHAVLTALGLSDTGRRPAFPGRPADSALPVRPEAPDATVPVEPGDPASTVSGEQSAPAPAFPVRPAEVFPTFVVVHADDAAAYAEEIRAGLAGPVRMVRAGHLDQPARREVLAADVVIAVASRKLFERGYPMSVEWQELGARHEDRRLTVVPVIALPCAWEHGWFGRLAPLPSGGRPMSAHESRDEAVKNVLDSVRLLVRQTATPEPAAVDAPPPERRVRIEDVFRPVGVPGLTFVESTQFRALRRVLAQPGLGVVLEGPSGIGKTTLLRRAAEQDGGRLGPVRILHASRRSDLSEIEQLPDGHDGIVAVDDFHRLPARVQNDLVEYLKALTDAEPGAKLVLVGIPGTAGELVPIPDDLAARIRVIRLEPASETLVLQMIEKGEQALNISFRIKREIAVEASGSLQTAQALCWQLADLAGIDQTTEHRVAVGGDLVAARAEVLDGLHIKFGATVRRFTMLDGPDHTVCIDLLGRLGEARDGVLRLDDLAEDPGWRKRIDPVFLDVVAPALDEATRRHLFFDPAGRRLVADDPQFPFYLRHLGRDVLLAQAGKRPRPARTKVFICYSHKDKKWLDRVLVHLAPWRDELDVWSDQQIALGDRWEDEITAALDRTRVAILLVSADMIASPFVHQKELPRLYAAEEQDGCRIVPVLVAPSSFANLPELNRFQGPNTTGQSLAELREPDAEVVLQELGRQVREIIAAPA